MNANKCVFWGDLQQILTLQWYLRNFAFLPMYMCKKTILKNTKDISSAETDNGTWICWLHQVKTESYQLS